MVKIFTSNTSPGSAVSTKTGPVRKCPRGGVALAPTTAFNSGCSSLASSPALMRLSGVPTPRAWISTISPDLTLMAGGVVAS